MNQRSGAFSPLSSVALPASPGFGRATLATYGVFLLFLFLACSPALDSKFSLPKSIVLYTGTLVLSLLLIARLRRGNDTAYSRPVLLLALALGGWWIVTTPFALHVPTALYGEYDYYNGLWTHLCCLALFVASVFIPTDMRTVRGIVFLMMAAIVPVAAINILETTGLTSIGLEEVSTLGDRVAAGALMNFAIPFAALALVRSRDWGIRAGLGGLLALYLVSEFLSQGRGPWVGLVVAMFIVIVGATHSKARWKAIGALIAVSLVLGGLAAKLNPAVAKRFATLTHVTQDESLGQRLVYYRAALRAVQDHPITGIGFENFRNVYPAYRASDDIWFFGNIIPTMVHNGYLETALNNGILALVLYVALIATVLFRLGKELARAEDHGHRDLLLGLLAAISAYLVQDMTGWLDLGLAPAFWVALGLSVNQTGHSAPQASGSWARPALVTFSGVMIVLCAYLLNNGYARLVTDSKLFTAQSLDPRTQWREMESLTNQALLALPADSRTEMVAGQIYVNRFLSSNDPAAYARGRQLLESSYRDNRFERMRLINIIALESVAIEHGQIDTPSDFAQTALAELSKTDGDNPAFHELKAKFLAAQRRFDEALAAIREAQRLAPQEERYRAREVEYQKLISAR